MRWIPGIYIFFPLKFFHSQHSTPGNQLLQEYVGLELLLPKKFYNRLADHTAPRHATAPPRHHIDITP